MTPSGRTVYANATIVAGLACGFLTACPEPPSAPIIIAQEQPSEAGLAPAQVALPQVPPLTILDIPRTYEDGTYSISGLMLSREALREEEIEVTGIISTIYQCEGQALVAEGSMAAMAMAGVEPLVRETTSVGCNLPHLYIVDNLRSAQRLLVTGYDAEHWEPQLRPGTRYTFAGRYAQRAAGFLSTEYGLLVADSIEGSGVVAPGAEGSALPTP
jgi:hypothetical protein